ncbi:MAG TPA: hypothetical protein VJ983_09995 [candidate division Zixibacteria bacterium]|nr:hypothetical protein [candidate division Zixibacteria bacterium]
MKKLLVLTISLLFATSAFAQFADQAKINESGKAYSFGVKPAVTPFSLLDLSRIKWSTSYSFGYVSGGSYSGSMGVLNTTAMYEFSPKLSMMLNLGIEHNTGAIWGDGKNNATLLPGFQLDYHPSEKFHMSIGVQRYSGFLTPRYNRSDDLLNPYTGY